MISLSSQAWCSLWGTDSQKFAPGQPGGDWDLQIPCKAGLSRSELIYWVPSYINMWVNCHVLGDKGCFVWHCPVLTFLLAPGNSNLRAGWGPCGWESQIKLVRLLPRRVFWVSLNPFPKKKKKPNCWQLFNVDGFITLQRLTWKTATFL